MKKKLIYSLVVIIWMIVIFCFSSQTSTSSSDMTVSLLDKVLSFLNLENFGEIIDLLFMPVRKMAHYLIYLILGFLVLNLVKEYNLTFKEIIIASLLICILYAVSDEVHQTFVPGRAGMLVDVCIDTLGSISGMFIYYVFRKSIFKYFLSYN